MEFAIVVAVYLALSSWQARNLVATNTVAPAFALTSLDGKTVTLESLKGKKVLLHFWATWCGVCRQEFGALNAVEQQLAPDEVLLTVAADSDDPERIRRFVEDEHIQYPVLLGTEAVLRAFHVSSFPTNYFLNGDGRIAGHTVGMSTRWGLAARLGCAKE
jgi:peroxiredoxin